VREELPADVPAALGSMQNESREPETASLFPGEVASPHEKKILRLLKADESTHIDQMVELLENEMSYSEIFAALFELELNGKIRQLPGEEFCEELLVVTI
jgi:DNA processing protein